VVSIHHNKLKQRQRSSIEEQGIDIQTTAPPPNGIHKRKAFVSTTASMTPPVLLVSSSVTTLGEV
jgi:hypothetical protein